MVVILGYLEFDDLDDKQFNVWSSEASISRNKRDLLDEYIDNKLNPEDEEGEYEDDEEGDED